MINVTKIFFPPLIEYNKQLERIWKNEWLTNRGELILELEEKLKKYLSVDNILITNNGTVPIQIALKLLGNNGEIITTPFSYVATSAAIVWENCTPVFVDIGLLDNHETYKNYQQIQYKLCEKQYNSIKYKENIENFIIVNLLINKIDEKTSYKTPFISN